MAPTDPEKSPSNPAREGRGETSSGRSTRWDAADESTRVIAYMLAGPAVWGGAGWLADSWLGTGPWLLSIGLLLGFAAAFYLIWMRSTHVNALLAAERKLHTEREPEEG